MAPITERTVAPPTGGISSSQEQDLVADEGNTLTTPQIVGGVFGAALLSIGAMLLLRGMQERRHSRHTHGAIAQAEEDAGSSKVIASDLVLEEGPTLLEDSYDSKDGDNQSEVAQYAPGELLDSISVGPSVASSAGTADDFTVTTAVGVGRATSPTSPGAHPLSPQDSSSRAAAMAYASNETFERDRLVALQKDLLQSDWTSNPVPTNANARGLTMATPFARPRSSSSHGSVDDNRDGELSFEQAYEGEEMTLMPPKSTRRRSGNDIV